MSSEALASETTSQKVLPFSFTGNSTEYFKIYIVNIFLTIITLGIYSAWAKVRNNRYLYGNTQLDNHHFMYHADPVKILKGRVIAITFLIVYTLSWDFFPNAAIALLGVGLFLFPFFLVTATSFQMRNTSYRNLRFFFDRNYWSAYKQLALPLGIILLLSWAMYSAFDINWMFTEEELQIEGEEELTKSDFFGFIVILAVMPVIPYLDFIKTRFILNNTQYGQLPASFAGGAWDFYKLYLKTMVLSMVLFSMVSAFVGLLIYIYSRTSQYQTGETGMMEALGASLLTILVVLVFYGLSFLISAYLRAKRTNMIFNQTQIQDLKIVSRLRTLHVFWLYLSNIVMIILSFGLLIPWAKIRMCRYVASCTEIETDSLESIQAIQERERSALGEEMADAFDMEIGL